MRQFIVMLPKRAGWVGVLVEKPRSICLWEVHTDFAFFENMNSVHCIFLVWFIKLHFFYSISIGGKMQFPFFMVRQIHYYCRYIFLLQKMVHFRNTRLIYRKWFFFQQNANVFFKQSWNILFFKKLNQLDNIAKSMLPSSASK